MAMEAAIKVHKNLFPPVFVSMVSIGEKSGTVDTLLTELAEFYEEQVDAVVKNIASIIEPLLILFMGVVVGGIAVAVIMPMYSLTQQI